MTCRLLCLIATLCCVTLPANAADISVLAASCAGCHDDTRPAPDGIIPAALAGQRADYLARQLRNFRSGIRGYHRDDKSGSTMRAIAATLKDDEIESIARHFSQQQVAAPAAAQGDANAGKARYLGTCAACHGLRAEGYGQLHTPRLTTLSAAYLGAQMNSFVKGWRGDAGGFDQPSLWMRSIAAQVSDPIELANIIAYIATLR